MMRYTPFTDRPARVLIVDDERHNRRVIEVMLEPDGYALEFADTGEEALALVASHPPDLILLDVMMPGMDGYEVAAAIKRRPESSNIPIIMVTALDDREARLAGLNAGAEDFLSKPLDRAELSVRVRNLIRLKALLDDHDKHAHALEVEVGARTADLRAAIEALREAEARTQFALESANVGIWDFDFRSGTVRWSPLVEAQYGLVPGQFAGTFEAFLELVHPEDRASVAATMEAAKASGEDFAFHNRALWADGSVRWLSGAGRIHLGPDGEAARGVGISQDVTGRHTLEAQHQQAQKMEAVGQLAAGVAHDFNNLLTVISGFAELSSEGMGNGSQGSLDLDEIIKAAQRASGLTRQLLAFSRQQVLHAAPLDINGVITDMTRMLTRLIGADVEVVLGLAPTLPLALVDRGQLEQVLMNLVVNARDAMPTGGTVTIETADVTLENSLFHDEPVVPGRYVMFAVTDTGTGMSAETQRRLFEPFFTTKPPGQGTGLGLATTYGIIKQSKGHLIVYSELGRGTTFRTYLPCAPTDAAGAALEQPAVTLQRGSETILLVEDEAAVRGLSKRILSRAGYRVIEATDGNDAEKVFEGFAGTIDLVVTDVVMPGCGGPELVRRLKARSPGIRVLFMSGYTAQTVIRQVDLDGNVPILQKPFTAADLTQQVRVALDR